MTDSTEDHDIDPPLADMTEPLRRALGDRYLTYALSTIMNRALPDARDGLKPVHRRILYAMSRLKLSPTGGFLKSAKISGDTMGDFHPHGDAAIYDAMARLAQDFNVRYPLVGGQGNFGSSDGDNPAASRYTEARMTVNAEALLVGLSENAVDFRPNYDGRLEEPSVLPATFPNLLANGSSGIAVGMATNIPPHNLHELIDACLHLIKTPEARDETLLNYIPGPDFPTGGTIVEPRENIAEAYRTGRGSFRLRSKWEIEDLGRGQWQIIITEIPYQVQKSKLIEKLAEVIQTKKVPLLADVRDESADDIRVVLEPRSKTVDPEVLMGMLFRNSDLETRFSLNMNVLIDGLTPKVCSLKEVLRAFLDHRQDVLQRRSKHRMDKFIIVSFLALGVGFYELSGGADFVPEQPDVVAAADTTRETPIVITSDVEVTRSNAASLIALNPEITPVSLETTTAPTTDPEPVVVEVAAPAPAAIQEPQIDDVVAQPLDLRSVAGTRVNMRQGPGTNFDVLDTLDGGTQTEVLEVNASGWARIQVVTTGQIGWMAERLLTDG